MARRLETTPPLSQEEYARTFATVIAKTTEYTAMKNIAKSVITDNKLDTSPIHMLSVGAGTGGFEMDLVRELGLKLNYICAIEPNYDHGVVLETALRNLDVEYDINRSFFSKDFEFSEESKAAKLSFDLILFSHSLYGFDDPDGAVAHATNFLKPNGKILVLHQGAPGSADLFTFLTSKSDPKIFSARKTFVDHSLTAETIISRLKENYPNIPMKVFQEKTYVDVDSFVRKTSEPNRDNVISFFLQAEYKDLSEEAQEDIYKMVVGKCTVIDGKYFRAHLCVGIVLSGSGF